MNTLGTLLVWCALQVTLVAIATGIAYLLARRRGASLRGSIVLTGLITATLLIPLLLVPWPRWELPRAAETRSEPARLIKEIKEDTQSRVAPQTNRNPTNDQPPSIELDPITWRTHWNHFVDALETPQSPASPVSPPSPDPNRWPRLILALFAVALAMGLARLIGGYWSVRRTIRSAPLVRDSRVLELADVLRAELSCKQSVELRETHKTATAATTGWRRPVILLPIGWRNWTTSQTRAVLAHELAHVTRRDYLIGCLAQIALALHFYHPLWQWLVARLRLEQELAADALAASITGGRETYLKNLAELALRRSDTSVAWPARAFLPSRHTFLRRIEMLRDPKRAVDRSAPWLRIACVAGLLAFGVLISGVRPGAAIAQNSESDNAPINNSTDRETAPNDNNQVASSTDKASTLDGLAAYIPPNVLFVVTARPRQILNDPAIKPHAKQIEDLFSAQGAPGLKILRAAGVVPENIEAIAIGISPGDPTRGSSTSATFAIHLAKPAHRQAIERAAEKSTPALGGVVYQLPRSVSVALPSENTLVIADAPQTVAAMLLGGQINRANSPWTRLLSQLDDPALAVLIDTGTIAAEMQMVFANVPANQQPPYITPLLPMLQDMKLASLALRLGDHQGLVGYAHCHDAQAASRVAETLEALVTLGKNTVRQFRIQNDNNADPELKALIPLAEKILDSVSIEAKDSSVRLTSDSDASASLVAVALPALQHAREAAYRTRSQNNLKQIGLAFHNYHDAYGHFPPAVIEENGVKRSWRVEILPFVEAANLYEQYRKDEPWDSENNKKVLAQMPEVFRDPSDDSDLDSTSYFVLTSEYAVSDKSNNIENAVPPPGGGVATFSRNAIDVTKGGKGTTLMNIADGTSNTLMVVEASRNIPWTKPEDIPFDPEKIAELLKEDLGGNHEGGFFAVLCDGSVRFVSKMIDLKVLSHLITPSDGHPIGEF